MHSTGVAVFEVTAHRPVDPNWDNRGREVQQYEMRVKRLDVEFGEQLKALMDQAKSKGLWPGLTDPSEYWARGFSSYFDAGKSPAETRGELEAYDPGLFELVRKTMAYDEHPDWRYTK